MTKSETRKNNVFNQWVAGFIDADGYFGLSKRNQASCELTTDFYDAPLLLKLQTRFGGSVKPRAGSASVRWRLSHRHGMVDLCNAINGQVRNHVRVIQFTRTCAHLGLTYVPAVALSPDSGYFAGLFAGDGSINIGVGNSSPDRSTLSGRYGKIERLKHARGHCQLHCHVDSTDRDLLLNCARVLNIGSVVTKNPSVNPRHKRPNVGYRWHWTRFSHVGAWRAYVERCNAPKSIKHRRLILTHLYFELKQNKCHLAPENSLEFNRWAEFCQAWHRSNIGAQV